MTQHGVDNCFESPVVTTLSGLISAGVSLDGDARHSNVMKPELNALLTLCCSARFSGAGHIPVAEGYRLWLPHPGRK